MNDEYTPTTATIRSGYASWSPNRRDVVSLALGFDRWLAEHDNAIRAENRPIVHFEDDHEECARDLAEVRMTRDAFLQYLRIAERNLAAQSAVIEEIGAIEPEVIDSWGAMQFTPAQTNAIGVILMGAA